MAILKCKMCGGTLDVNNETVAVCEYCGTKQTISKSKNIENESSNKFLKKEKYSLVFANHTFMKILYITSFIISCFCGVYFFLAGFLEGDISLLFDLETVLNFFLLIFGFISIAPIFIFKKKFKNKIIPIILQGITVALSLMWFLEWIDLVGLQITFSVILNLIIQATWFLIICFVKKEEI